MSSTIGKLNQRVSLLGLSAVLAVSSLATLGSALLVQTAGATATSVPVYDSLPSVSPPTNYASLGFQATQTSEFGDYVHLASGPRQLNTVTVTMSDWALQATPANLTFCEANANNCDTTGFFWPITVNVYSNTLTGGVPTDLLGTKTVNVHVPWRPVAYGCDATGWMDTNDNCNHGLAFNATFDLSSLDVTLPDDVIVGFEYNTQTYGTAPTGVDGPYNSLNVAIPDNQSAVVGSDTSADSVYWKTATCSYYSISGACNVFREDTNWSPNGTVAFQLTATAPAPPVAPTLTVATPAVGQYVSTKANSNNLKIAGTFTDDVKANHASFQLVKAGIGSVATGIVYGYGSFPNPAATYADAAGNYTYNMPVPANLGDGEYTLFYTGTDFAGGVTARMERTFNIDNTPPVGQLNTIAGKSISAGKPVVNIAGNQLVVTGVAKDDLALNRIGVQLVKVGVSGGLQYVYANNNTLYGKTGSVNWNAVFDTTGLNLKDGEYAINVSYVDKIGNVSKETVLFTIDNTKPHVTGSVESPFNPSSFTVTATDSFGTIKTVVGNIYDATTNVLKKSNSSTTQNLFRVDLSTLAEGSYYVKYNAADMAGNVSNTEEFHFTVDSIIPATPAAQNPNGWTSSASGFMWTSASDNGSPVHYSLQYSRTHPNNVADTTVNDIQSNIYTPASALTDGPLFWRVKAIDAAGNESVWSAMQYANIDGQAPLVAVNLTDSQLLKGIKSIVATITEQYAKTYSISVLNSDSTTADTGVTQTPPQNTGSISYEWNTKHVIDGNYIVRVVATDVIGHTTTKDTAVVVDNHNPTNIITQPIDGLVTNKDTLAIEGTASDPNFSFYRYYVWDSNNKRVTPDVKKYTAVDNGVLGDAIDISGLSDGGTYRLRLSTADKSNNWLATYATFTIDRTAPDVSFSKPSIDSSTGSWTPKVDAGDATSYLWSAAKSNPDGLTFTATDKEPTFTPAPKSYGVYAFTLVATDAAGNESKAADFSFTYAAPDAARAATPADTTAAAPLARNLVAFAATPAATTGAPAVLGAQTTTNTTQAPAADALGTSDVKGASDQLAAATPSSSSTGLAWYWWALIIAAVVSFVWWLIARMRSKIDEV